MSEEQSALEIWTEKLNELQRQEAIASDAAVKFQLKKQIQECQQKIQELQQQEGKILLNTKQSDYYIERPPIEQRCYQELLTDGALIRIRASQKMGKSMLMNRMLKFVEEDYNYQIAYLDLDEPEFNIVTDLSRLLKYFCQEVSKELGVPNQTNEHWEQASATLETSENMKCRNYFEQNVLPHIKTALVLGLDNVDRLFSEDCQLVAADFFGMMRSWHNRGKRKKLWKKFKVILVYSTEAIPNLGVYESPFNVGLENTLSGFSEEQILSLARHYDCSVSKESAKVLLTQLGGHPYLIHLILESLSINKAQSLNELLAQASTEEGIYNKHFQNYWKHLQEKPLLAKSLYETVKSDSPILIPPKILYELERLGLIKKVGDKVCLKCELYRTYFLNHLKILENIWRGNIDGIN